MARHAGIDTTRAKLALFALSALFMTLTGAVMAPRWTYIDPAIAFNPMLSFQVVIMALLGGAGALFGPLLGVIPLVLLFEVLTANFPNHFSILLGLVFVAHRLCAAARRDRAVQYGAEGRVGACIAATRRPRRSAVAGAPLCRSKACARRSAGWSRSTTLASRSRAARSSA